MIGNPGIAGDFSVNHAFHSPSYIKSHLAQFVGDIIFQYNCVYTRSQEQISKLLSAISAFYFRDLLYSNIGMAPLVFNTSLSPVFAL
jgi:hypothetical protein